MHQGPSGDHRRPPAARRRTCGALDGRRGREDRAGLAASEPPEQPRNRPQTMGNLTKLELTIAGCARRTYGAA
eukprot:14401594-Alexandrium_andersonii.AAC.1